TRARDLRVHPTAVEPALAFPTYVRALPRSMRVARSSRCARTCRTALSPRSRCRASTRWRDAMNAPSTATQPVANATVRGSLGHRLRQWTTPRITLLRRLTLRRIGFTILVAAAFASWSAFGGLMRIKYGWEPQPIGVADFFFHGAWGWLPLF